MEYKIVVKKRFAANLLALLLYLEKEWGKKVADEFQQRIAKSFAVLLRHPFVGSPSKKFPGARGLLITKHNRLFYRIESNRIIILSLADTRRKKFSN